MLETLAPAEDIVPAQKFVASVVGVFAAQGDDFVTAGVEVLDLSFAGIAGDVHAGMTRRSGGREPWYPRGTEMRNERQVSIVAADELAEIAWRMAIAELRPEWIGANLVIAGVPQLSMLPPRTVLFFENGVTVRIDGQNAPCKLSGKSIAEHAGMADVAAAALLFPKVAKRLRGLVGWVEKPGRLIAGESVCVRVPEQWIYRG